VRVATECAATAAQRPDSANCVITDDQVNENPHIDQLQRRAEGFAASDKERVSHGADPLEDASPTPQRSRLAEHGLDGETGVAQFRETRERPPSR
jgi:hypothetical protein